MKIKFQDKHGKLQEIDTLEFEKSRLLFISKALVIIIGKDNRYSIDMPTYDLICEQYFTWKAMQGDNNGRNKETIEHYIN